MSEESYRRIAAVKLERRSLPRLAQCHGQVADNEGTRRVEGEGAEGSWPREAIGLREERSTGRLDFIWLLELKSELGRSYYARGPGQGVLHVGLDGREYIVFLSEHDRYGVRELRGADVRGNELPLESPASEGFMFRRPRSKTAAREILRALKSRAP